MFLIYETTTATIIQCMVLNSNENGGVTIFGDNGQMSSTCVWFYVLSVNAEGCKETENWLIFSTGKV